MNKNESFRFGKLTFSTGIGSSSILVIFVILCLVSFATLSIVSANADYKLSSKVLERTTGYHEASNQAEASLAELDKQLLRFYEECISEEDYYKKAGYGEVFTIPLSETQSLEVTVSIQYPKEETDTFYRIEAWQVVSTGEQIIVDEPLNLIK